MVSIKRPMLNCKDNPGKGALKSVLKSLRTYLGNQVFSMCLVFSLPDQILIVFWFLVSPGHHTSSKEFSQLKQHTCVQRDELALNRIPSQPCNTSTSQGSYVAVQGDTTLQNKPAQATHIDSWDHDIPSIDPAQVSLILTLCRTERDISYCSWETVG